MRVFNKGPYVLSGMGLLIAMVAVSFSLITSSCATSMTGKAYDVLYAGEVVGDTALTYAGDQYRAGKISEAQKDQIIDYAKKYKLALTAGQKALEAYKRAETLGEDLSGKEKALIIALDAAEAAKDILLDYIQKTERPTSNDEQPTSNEE